MIASYSRKSTLAGLCLAACLGWAAPALAFNWGGVGDDDDSPDDPPPTDTGGFEVERVLDGLDSPWGMTFLPDGRLLVTEQAGQVSVIDVSTGQRSQVSGVPDATEHGEGGLMDVAVHPDFANNRWVYLTYADGSSSQGYATHLGRGRLDLQSMEITNWEELYVATPFDSASRHFGSRMIFDEEWNLYFSVGDRATRERAQDLSSRHGKIFRLTDDGEIPADNPFVDREDAEPAVYTLGNRNVQGIAVDPRTTRIWFNEHGPRAGDEVNILSEGANYGWPVASYGREYTTNEPVGVLPPERPDLEQPVYYWEESSFAPSDMAFYDGDAFPEWQNSVFMGALARQNLTRLELQGNTVVSEETLLEDRGWRVRAVETGPDGNLYLLVDDDSAPLVRLVPADG